MGARSRLLTDFVREHRCDDPALLDEVCAAAQADMAQGLHALLLADYEWGVRLMGVRAAHADGAPGALRILMFRTRRFLSSDEVGAWFARQAGGDSEPDASADRPSGFFGWKASVNREEFTRAIEKIRELIAAGETYQINYSYRLEGWAHGHPAALYRALRRRQPVPYGAFIRLPEQDGGEYLLSLSPELFLSLQDDCLVARPMKGTARVPERDVSQAANALSSDPKNRAENVMIVDLLRNDLSRVARSGTVKVPALFEVEPHGSVLQMTSRVEASLATGATLADILRAAFPCGSITGAPKKHSMELIGQLESTPRGIYTGAIGWIEPPVEGASCGPLCLSVAIRTVTLGAEVDGLRRTRFGVGAGIVWDSDPALEYAECQIKSAFLAQGRAGFGLIETMRASPGRIPLLQRHLARLRASAAELAFAFDESAVRTRLEAAMADVREGAWAVRLCLQSDGSVDLSTKPLAPIDPAHHRLLLAPMPPGRSLRLARHKTTLRRDYDQGVSDAIAAGAFDTLYYTADGRLVEGGRSNVLVCLDGHWYTPPLEDGALPGVMRAVLLSAEGVGISQRSIGLDELQRASAVVACNALRGVIRITAVGEHAFGDAGTSMDPLMLGWRRAAFLICGATGSESREREVCISNACTRAVWSRSEEDEEGNHRPCCFDSSGPLCPRRGEQVSFR